MLLLTAFSISGSNIQTLTPGNGENHIYVNTSLLPANGFKLNYYEITFGNFVEQSGMKQIWDFSDNKVLRDNSIIEFRNIGDSVFDATDRFSREDMRLVADTLYLIGKEDKNSRVIYDSPIIMSLFPVAYNANICANKFSAIYDVHKHSSVKEVGNNYITADAQGVIITPECDTLDVIRIKNTIEGVMMAADSSYMYNHMKVAYSWFAIGMNWPVAIGEIECYKDCNGRELVKSKRMRVIKADNDENTVESDNVCLREDVSSNKNYAQYSVKDDNVLIKDKSADSGLAIYVDQKRVKMSVAGGISGRLLITDIIGRVYCHKNIKGGSDMFIDISNFIRGEYLAHIITESGTFVKRFHIF